MKLDILALSSTAADTTVVHSADLTIIEQLFDHVPETAFKNLNNHA